MVHSDSCQLYPRWCAHRELIKNVSVLRYMHKSFISNNIINHKSATDMGKLSLTRLFMLALLCVLIHPAAFSDK